VLAEPVLMEAGQEDQAISGRGPVHDFLRRITRLELLLRGLR
jgi:hypothetical protein